MATGECMCPPKKAAGLTWGGITRQKALGGGVRRAGLQSLSPASVRVAWTLSCSACLLNGLTRQAPRLAFTGSEVGLTWLCQFTRCVTRASSSPLRVCPHR